MSKLKQVVQSNSNLNKSVGIVLSTALWCITSGSMVHAASPGAYIGGGVGVSAIQGLDEDAQQDKDNGVGGRVFVGYNLNRYFGIEGNYSMFSKTSYELYDFQGLSIDYKANALSLVAKGYLPLTENDSANLYALVGFAQTYADIDLKYFNIAIADDSDNGIVPVFGGGINYEINNHFTTSLEVSVFGDKDADYHFGIQRAVLGTVNLAYKF